MKIYTRGGDEGDTSLLGGIRVSKTDPRVEAYGTVDELNAVLGLALSLDEEGALGEDADALRGVQGDLLTVGAGLAAARPGRERERGTVPELPADRVAQVEAWIDRLAAELPDLDAFLLPGGCPAGAQLHVARTVCRRAERAIVRLSRGQSGPAGGVAEPPDTRGRPATADADGARAEAAPGGAAETASAVLPYLNRLSDLLFMLARAANARAGAPEAEWTPVRRRSGEERPAP